MGSSGANLGFQKRRFRESTCFITSSSGGIHWGGVAVFVSVGNRPSLCLN